MHEISLVQNLLSQIRELATENNRTKVTEITLEIGPFAGVVTESFQFGFDCLSGDDALFRGAKLEIVSPRVQYSCSNCHHMEVTSGSKPTGCAKCGELFLIPEGGDDLILKQVVME